MERITYIPRKRPGGRILASRGSRLCKGGAGRKTGAGRKEIFLESGTELACHRCDEFFCMSTLNYCTVSAPKISM